ncbi:hypothetical protein ASZ90_001745 [hydrocarbon metagenome]|uniref:Uncharacterized protein n=1 Tax=hydrocarbon metagenome TaxID=938273 RepID=A0A0W8G5F9_9ZZZZ
MRIRRTSLGKKAACLIVAAIPERRDTLQRSGSTTGAGGLLNGKQDLVISSARLVWYGDGMQRIPDMHDNVAS